MQKTPERGVNNEGGQQNNSHPKGNTPQDDAAALREMEAMEREYLEGEAEGEVREPNQGDMIDRSMGDG